MQKNIQGEYFPRIVFTGVLLILLSVSVFAQFRAGVQGTVFDSAGATIPAATVTLTSLDTNQTQQTVTNDSGFYRFSGLAPGNYKVSVEKEGF
ncbi:MAG TPA: carboxypeptidase-like regulatory domain-containing protein, partial [Pyrinomonadaceae bacterium]|nr:carboxypeptidase-like regulatory domain-containing protein [Pyrinomonadaceae bacterium]